MKWFTKERIHRELPVKGRLAGQAIRSDYVLNKLRQTTWDDRAAIFELIKLERILLDGPRGWIEAMASSGLRHHYRDAANAIESEFLTSEEFTEKERIRIEISRRGIDLKAEVAAKQMAAEKSAKREWLTLGGKP